MLKLSELKDLLELDNLTPSGLKWKKLKICNQVKIGDMDGSLRPDGYYQVKINSKVYLTHRVVFALFYNIELDQLPKYLDHIDRDKTNNSPLNLRVSTSSQNNVNRNLQKSNTSGFKGVHWHKLCKKWRAQISKDGKRDHLGWFDTIEEAAEAYKKASIKYHGDFSTFN